jgi:hypothetical protein
MANASPYGVDHGRLDGGRAKERAIAPDAEDADEIDGEVEGKERQDRGDSAAREVAGGIAREFLHGRPAPFASQQSLNWIEQSLE